MYKAMNINDVKQIKIADYLQSLGYELIKQQGRSLWYKSPLRDEKDPSFKVNIELNKWYDFGLGKGGNIIALAEELYNSNNVSYLLDCISRQMPHIRPVSVSFGEQPTHLPMFQSLQIGALQSPPLLSYLQERGIDIELAKRECRELRYIHNGKEYFAIGFPNLSGGFEVRNRYFKGCVAPKDISHIKPNREQLQECYLFEGFMDYLSFLTLQVRKNISSTRQDYMVLNSVTNLSKAETLLSTYNKVGSFLDNDQAGRTAFQTLQGKLKERLKDMSVHYGNYKDLNDYLCDRNLLKQMERKPQVQSVRRIQKPQPKKKGGFRL